MAQWYLNEPFKAEAVYGQLARMDYDYVVGMDIGDGECMIYLFDREKNEIDRMKLNYGGDAKLATMISLNQGGAIIGKAAANRPQFVQNFKVAPAQWRDPAVKIDGKTYTYRDLMLRFISTLWETVIKEDSHGNKLKEAVRNRKVLIAVGCPSSPDWTGQEAANAYQRLVAEATGCGDVTILAESTAAIMSAVLDLNELAGSGNSGFQLNQGIAVVDAGSSTIDFTYVLLGKKLITRSLDVAGHILDEQLLAVALERSGLMRKDIPEEQIPKILVMLRALKENFYPAEIDMDPQSIPLWGRNAQGQVDKSVDSGKYLKFVFNREFVTEAVRRADIQRGLLEAPMSWQEHCEKFVRDCSALIPRDERDRMICSKVILTGGTSFVTELRRVAEEVYGAETVSASPNRDASVARGLCHAKALEINGLKCVEGYKAAIDKLADRHHAELLKQLADHLTTVVCKDLLETVKAMESRNGKVTAGMMLDVLNQKVRSNPMIMGEEGRQRIQALIAAGVSKAQKGTYDAQGKLLQSGLQEEVDKASKAIYGAKLEYIPQLPMLTQKELARLLGSMDLSGLINEAWINAVMPSFIFSILATLLKGVGTALLFGPFAQVGALLLALGALLESTKVQQGVTKMAVKKNTEISKSMLKRIGGKLEDKGSIEKIREKSREKMVQELRKKNMLKKEFFMLMQNQAEAALGKVLFLVYDEQPDMQ